MYSATRPQRARRGPRRMASSLQTKQAHQADRPVPRKSRRAGGRTWLLTLSGQGWWRRSGSPPATGAMTLQWLRLFGLVSLVAHHAALNLLERAIIEVLGVC